MTAFLYSILGGGMGWMISNMYGRNGILSCQKETSS